MYSLAEVLIACSTIIQRSDRLLCHAERVLTKERIKLLRLAMESYSVSPACYDVMAVNKRDKAVHAAPRWNTSHPPKNVSHSSVQYELHGNADRHQSLHDGLSAFMSRWGPAAEQQSLHEP